MHRIAPKKESLFYWHTKRGRSTAMYIVTAVAGTVGGFHFLPQNTFKDYLMESVMLYREAMPVPVHPKIENRVKEAMKILDATPVMEKLTKPFTVFGFDLYSIGSTKSRNGLAIGVPTNYNYETEDDIDKASMRVNFEPVDWGTEAGQQLEQSLIVPEKVQIFGICNEILAHSNYAMHLKSMYSVLPFAIAHLFSSVTNTKYDLFNKPRYMRFTFYGIAAVLGVGIYCALTDFTQRRYERSIDEELCELGADFAQRGVEFYDKLLKRNVALREMMGEEGKKIYASNGNENFLFRMKHVPLTERKKFFESKLSQRRAVIKEDIVEINKNQNETL